MAAVWSIHRKRDQEKAGSPLERLFPDSRCKTLKTWIRVKTMEI